MNTGKTKNLGIIGFPVEHSLSPVLQNAALTAAGLDFSYIAMPVRAKNLESAVRGIQSLGFRGFNVTIPHKTAIMPFLDSVDESARIIGAVNTVVNDKGQLCGYNTDVSGFSEALIGHGFMPAGKTAALLGAGGAARAVIWGLVKNKIGSIRIGVRNVAKARPLTDFFNQYVDIELFDWEDALFQKGLAAADLLVNTTPLGMNPHTEAMPLVKWEYVDARTFVYDVIYTPEKTKFLLMAEKNGNTILNGMEMLLGQGAAAFKLWTGKSADAGVMAAALHKALGI